MRTQPILPHGRRKDAPHVGTGRLARPLRAAPILAACLLVSPPAHAAGGADVVDDSFVETPGTCHIETWFTGAFRGGTLSHAGLGCTPKSAHLLEIDAAIERTTGGGATEYFEPGLKYTLYVLPARLAVGVSGTLAVDQHGRLAGAALTVPVALTLGKYTAINVDVGYQLTRAPGRRDRNDMFWGAQIAQAVAPHFTLIGETYGFGHGSPGAQGGVRWSPGPQRVDIDLRVSTGPASAGRAATLGVTVRF